MQKPTVRLSLDAHKNAKKLVGYLGHKSLEDVVSKAVLEYVAKHEKKSK